MKHMQKSVNEGEYSLIIVGLFSAARVGNWSDCIDIAGYLRTKNWKVITASNYLNRYVRVLDIIWNIVRYHRQYSVAQVDVYSGKAFIWAEISTFLFRLLRKPYILSLHGGNLPIFSKRWPNRVRRVFQHATLVTVPSPYLLNQMKPYHSTLFLLPSPMHLTRYSVRDHSRLRGRIVWLRSFEHETYNPELAVLSLGRLNQESLSLDLSLKMIGHDKNDGSLSRVHQLIQDLNLENHVSVYSAISKTEVPVILQESDIFLNTSNIDNTPISVIEAMACGLCIVSTNVGGIPYLLTHEHDALVVPPNNPQAMADAVRRILTEPGLAERLSLNARKTAEQFDWSIILPQWEALLMDVIERHSFD